MLGGAETGLPRPSHHFLPKSGSHDQPVLPPSSSNHICHSCCVSKCWPEGRVDLIREDALAIYCPGPLPAPPLYEDGRGRVNAQLMCHPILPAAQRSSYSFLMCSVQGPELFGAEQLQTMTSGKIQGASALKPLLSWCLCADCALQGSCLSGEGQSVLPVTSGRKFQSYQYGSMLCHTKQVKMLSAYMEICC